MTSSSYHRIILDGVIKRNHLPNPRLSISEPHPDHPFTATVEFKIDTSDGPTYCSFSSDSCNVRARAEDQACQRAIAGLDSMGYKRPHYKNELNNKFMNGSKKERTLDFYRTQSGPDDQRIHASTLMIDGHILQGYTATSTRAIYADELACKMYLEANLPELK